ncbi:MAG: sugar phosphate isomerase/epimerase [Defluviitaleaceae bacterium]|nr:sugar phosphate isomerase/epimerase [Defluviitaleaceae bacterium]
MEKKYIQLYSLKDVIFNDFVGTLKRVKDIGYTGVEFFGGFFGEMEAKELKKLLEDIGLEPISAHLHSAQIPDIIPYAAELGLKYLIDPMAHFNTYEEALEMAKTFNEVGKKCKEAGIQFGYHNHRHEFLESPDGYLMDTIIKNTNPDWVCVELDVGWTVCAGADAVAFINKHAGRIKLIHVKECGHVAGAEPAPDFSKFPKDENGRPQIPPEVLQKLLAELKWNSPAGKGLIDWKAVKDAALAQGAEGFIIEREYDYANDIWKCIEEDHAFIASL